MKRASKVLACFEEVGLDFDVTQFDSRLMAQKLVFLLQELGVDLGYGDYNFYLRGTYSPRLTKDLFSVQDASGVRGKSKLSARDKDRIRRLRETIQLRPHLLEVMAAYRFLRKEGLPQDEAIKTIKRTKPFLSERDVAIGVSKCKGIFPEVTQEDIESLHDEMAPWERAAAQDEL